MGVCRFDLPSIELIAESLGPDEGLVFAHDAASLAAKSMCNLTGRVCDDDIVFSPASAPGGYDDLIASSVTKKIGRVEAAAASLEDVLCSKEEVRREEDARPALVIRAFLRDRDT
jgi:hypothetical protein